MCLDAFSTSKKSYSVLLSLVKTVKNAFLKGFSKTY